jgi:Carboxypeptidase regulatory-like domain
MNRKWMLPCSICLALVLSFCASNLVMGQTTNTTGSVLGVVSDPSGAVLPGTTLTLKLEAAGPALTTQTNAAGQYSFPVVAPGTYILSASVKNFRTSVVSGVVVQVAKSTLINFALTMGAVSESVSVTASAQLSFRLLTPPLAVSSAGSRSRSCQL